MKIKMLKNENGGYCLPPWDFYDDLIGCSNFERWLDYHFNRLKSHVSFSEEVVKYSTALSKATEMHFEVSNNEALRDSKAVDSISYNDIGEEVNKTFFIFKHQNNGDCYVVEWTHF